LTNNLIQSCPDRVTPPLPFSSGEEYLRLLKEAQRESNPSSLISSRRDSPKVGSPKSPPNSPNPEPLTNEEELRGVFINYWASKVSTMSLFRSLNLLSILMMRGDEKAKRKSFRFMISSCSTESQLPQLTAELFTMPTKIRLVSSRCWFAFERGCVNIFTCLVFCVFSLLR
jgi:BNIP3